MIVLSLVLVIVAAVTLIAGFFQDESLTLIYVAIVSCVLAMAFLGIGVLQRKRSGKPASAGAYGSGAGSTPSSSSSAAPSSSGSSAPARSSAPSITPVRPKEPVGRATRESGEGSDESTQVIVRKTAAADAAKRSSEAPARKKAVVKKVVAKRPSTPAASEADATDTTSEATAAEEKVAATGKAKPAKKSSTKAAAAKKAPRAGKKATAKTSTTKKTTAKKSTAKKSTAKKSTAKKTAGAAGGKAEARAILATVKGLGPAKQDAVLSQFGSVAALRQASVDQLSDVKGVGEGLAKAIKDAVS